MESLPEKEEVIIWVELTADQRKYYKAIYENQIGTVRQTSAPGFWGTLGFLKVALWFRV